jgi:hypothetical protein
MTHTSNVVQLSSRGVARKRAGTVARRATEPAPAPDPFDKTLVALLLTMRHLHAGVLRLDRAEEEVAESIELLRRWAVSVRRA